MSRRQSSSSGRPRPGARATAATAAAAAAASILALLTLLPAPAHGFIPAAQRVPCQRQQVCVVVVCLMRCIGNIFPTPCTYPGSFPLSRTDGRAAETTRWRTASAAVTAAATAATADGERAGSGAGGAAGVARGEREGNRGGDGGAEAVLPRGAGAGKRSRRGRSFAYISKMGLEASIVNPTLFLTL